MTLLNYMYYDFRDTNDNKCVSARIIVISFSLVLLIHEFSSWTVRSL